MYEDIMEIVKISKEKHTQVIEAYSNKNLTQEKLLNYISKVNLTKAYNKLKVSTLIALDGTISMGQVLKKIIIILR